MMTEDALLRKEQISSYFERIQAKKDGDDQPKSGFSVGSSTTTGKISLFSSQIKFTSDVAPPPRTVELEKASTAAKCLAILGVTSSSAATTPALPTQEEITISRRLREQEIMKQYEDIKRVEEENRNRRPLVWDKPTFCPFGGETKSDDEASASEEDKSSESNKKNKKRKEPSSSSSRVAEKCSNLLRKSSSSSESIDPCSNLLRKTSSNPNRHNNLFPNFNMYGGMLSSASSVTVRTEWSKEEVNSFVEFTDKWILPGPKKKIKLDHTAEGSSSTTSSSNTEGGGGEGEYTRRSSIGRPFLPQKVLPSDQA
eukprot:scaffold33654_cov139-Skeletonema_marinoi.AAC.1